MTSTVSVPRRPDEPAPDLTDYVLVHRAMTTDMRSLARAVDRIARGHEPVTAQRATDLRDYLAGIGAEIRSHHAVEDDDVWPFLLAVAGHDAGLAGHAALTEDHHQLDPLLDEAGELAQRLVDQPSAGPQAAELATVLAALSALLDRHIADEERDVFPVIRNYVRVEDYQRLQKRFQGNLSPSALTFVVPWVISHATPTERAHVVGEAPWPLRLILRLFEGRFAAKRRRVLGQAS